MKPVYCLVMFVLLSVFQQPCYAQPADSIKSHLDSSIAVLKRYSLYAKRVDWPQVEKKVYDAARNVTTKAGAFEALKIAFNALEDKHAAYYQYDDQYRIENPVLQARYSDSIKAAWSRGPRIANEPISNIAYISIPFMRANKQEDIDQYANWIYDAVVRLKKQDPAGWIIDLRLNGGGNIRPMLAGLAMFFRDGVVSYYIDRDGNAFDEARFRDGDFLIDGVKQAAIHKKIPYLAAAKVAVLIGPGTASSGEGVALALKTQQNTRLFGAQSAGMANATNGFVFSNEESYFLLSTAYIGDPMKNPLPEFVTPHVPVQSNDHFSDIATDSVVKAALEWLQE